MRGEKAICCLELDEAGDGMIYYNGFNISIFFNFYLMIGKANYKIKIGGQILAKLKSTSQFLFMQGSKILA
jgi:hypothetical protein